MSVAGEIVAHIGWLKHYSALMTEQNWADMRLYTLRQLCWLERQLETHADELASRVAAEVFGYDPVRLRLDEAESAEFHGFVQDVVLAHVVYGLASPAYTRDDETANTKDAPTVRSVVFLPPRTPEPFRIGDDE